MQKTEEDSPLHITADKREIKDFRKPSPLCILLKSEMDYGMNLIGLHNGNKLYGLEGWASFIRKTLAEIGSS
jgi:hypothetical protein